MAIEIVVTSEAIARALGVSVEELIRRTELYNRTGRWTDEEVGAPPTPDAAAPAAATAAAGGYRYTIGSSKSGVCPICAPYAGVLTDGTGQDGVPVPPVHNNCVCTLVPVSFDGLGTDTGAALSRRFEWMGKLSWGELRDVVGEARMEIVRRGIAALEDLYDSYGLLIPLSRLPLSGLKGWLSMAQAADVAGMALDAVRDAAKAGKIEGAYRMGKTDWLIPVEWAEARRKG